MALNKWTGIELNCSSIRVSCFFVIAIFFSSAVPAKERLLTASEILVEEKNSHYAFSPKGKYLSYVQQSEFKNFLVIIDLNKLEVIFDHYLGSVYPDKVTWINSNRLILEINGSILSINKDGTDKKTIAGPIYTFHDISKSSNDVTFLYAPDRISRPKIMNLIKDNKDEILISRYDKRRNLLIEKVNIYSGDREELAHGKKHKITNWVDNLNGDIILGVRAEKSKVDFFVKKTPDSKKFVLHNKNQDDKQHHLNFSGNSLLNNRIFFVSGSYDRDSIYVSENLYRDKFRISEYSISQRRVLKPVLEDEKYDIGGFNSDASLLFDKLEEKLVGVRYFKTALHTKWLDERFEKIQSKINRKYPNSNNSILAWTADLGKILVYRESPRNYAKVYIFFLKENKFALLTDTSAFPKSKKIPAKQVAYYFSRDGVEHEAYLTLPFQKKPAKLPVVIIPHGGPFARFHSEFNPEAAYFATHGYAVLEVNYRGSSGFGRKYLMHGVKELAATMVDDIADSAKWMIDQHNGDPDKVFIMGASYGGYAALMSLARYPELYASAVSLSAPLDLLTLIKTHKKEKNYFAYDFWNMAAGDVRKEKDMLKSISPIHNILKLKAPYLIFHGESDPVIPVKQAKAFKQKLKELEIDDDRIIIIQDEGHGFSIKSNLVYYLEKTLSFFNQ